MPIADSIPWAPMTLVILLGVLCSMGFTTSCWPTERARSLQAEIRETDGLNKAATLIEEVLATKAG